MSWRQFSREHPVFVALCVGTAGAIVVMLLVLLWLAVTAQGGLIGRP